MAIQPTSPSDLGGSRIVRLAHLTGLDMTTTAVYNWYNNGPNTVLQIAWVLSTFSAFPDGTAPPATWAFSVGSNSSTTPNNMRAAGVISSAPSMPVVIGVSFSTSTLTPYIQPGGTVWFAITTATNGVGTFNATLFGCILAR
jgi:hypothetical protein